MHLVLSAVAAARSRALVVLCLSFLAGVGAVSAQSGDASPSDEQRIYALFRQGKHADCIALCRKVLASDPKRASAQHVLGRCLLATGKHGEALRELKRCLALKPTEAWMVQWTHVSLGQCHLQSGNEQDARTHFERAIRIGASANATRTAREALTRLAGQALPNFRFRTVDGDVFDRDAVRGHPVMFKFGPSW